MQQDQNNRYLQWLNVQTLSNQNSLASSKTFSKELEATMRNL